MNILTISLIILFAIPVAAQQEIPPIRNFLRVNADFCTGGQPRLEHLQQLKDEGVKAIINLRPPTEHRAAEEEARAKELGLKYFNIPFVFAEPKDEQATEFLKITDDPANRPAFIHCTGAIRVGAFWMIRRVLRDGWNVAAAEDEARKIGLKESPQLVEFARGYIQRHQKEPSVLEFLLTAAATDFHTHDGSGPVRFRVVRLGHVKDSSGAERYMLCGQFLRAPEAGKGTWTPFATIKTSGYEQWNGTQAAGFCQGPAVIWDKRRDLTTLLQRRFDSLR